MIGLICPSCNSRIALWKGVADDNDPPTPLLETFVGGRGHIEVISVLAQSPCCVAEYTKAVKSLLELGVVLREESK